MKNLFFVLCPLVLACEAPSIQLRLRLFAEDPEALAPGVRVEATLVDLQARDRLVRMDAVLDDEPAPAIEFALPGGGEYDVHVVTESPAGIFGATRCIVVKDSLATEIALEEIDANRDADGDTWPARDDCQDGRGRYCAFACPGFRADDCDDADPTLHPLSLEVCDDHVDQDCSGSDAVCGEEDTSGVE